MRKLLCLSVLIITGQISFAQVRISIDSVNAYIGQKAEICAKVYGVKSTEKITFINLGPHSQLPIDDSNICKGPVNFKEGPEVLYANKQICVTGTIAEYLNIFILWEETLPLTL